MTAPKLSPAQRRVLEQFRLGDDGTIYAELSLCMRAPIPLMTSIIDRSIDALQRRGLLAREDDGFVLTPAGRAALEEGGK